VTTLFFAWAGANHPLARLENMVAQWSGTPVVPPLPVAPKPKAIKPKEHHDHEHVAASKPHETAPKPESAQHVASLPVTPTPVAHVTPPATNPPAPFAAMPTVPVALPVDPASLTNAPPAVPAVAVNPGDTNATPLEPANTGEPAAPVATYSAFAARDVAERSLDPTLVTPSGHAELLRIIGERDPTSITPTTWKFYFFDKNAGGHARIVTVTDGRVVKSGEDLVDSLTPYDEDLVMPEDQVQKDSTDVLAIAQAQVPDVAVNGSEFLLSQVKSSVPMWKVTLWGKPAGSDERKLAEITLLAETGTLIRDVKP
jgi:hypothetical protein